MSITDLSEEVLLNLLFNGWSPITIPSIKYEDVVTIKPDDDNNYKINTYTISTYKLIIDPTEFNETSSESQKESNFIDPFNYPYPKSPGFQLCFFNDQDGPISISI